MRNGLVARGIAGVVVIAAVFSLAACTPGTVVRSLAQGATNTSNSNGEYVPIGPDGLPDGDYADGGSGDAGYSESGFEPVEVDGPIDWQNLVACNDDSGGSPWVLVETFPHDAIDESEIYPFCGDTFVSDRVDSYVGAVATASEEQIYLLGGKLLSAGYRLSSDDFGTAAYGGTGQYIGAREYTLGDATLIISAYDNGVHPASLTVFLDYYSPETRALAQAQS